MSKLYSVLITITRILNVIRPHEHSIYTRCWVCHHWGVNLPNEEECANCGSCNTSEYYPTRNYYGQKIIKDDQTGNNKPKAG